MASRAIAIFSGKGGVGKTFLATSLGSTLVSEFRKRVLLVEANLPSPGLGVFLNIVKPAATIQDVLSGAVTPERAVFHHDNGLDVIPGALSIGREGADLSGLGALSPIFQNYDFVIIDGSGTITESELSFAKLADETLVVATPDLPSVTGAMKLIGTFQSQGAPVRGIVLNRSRAGEKHELKDSEVEGSTGQRVLLRIPEDSAVLQSITSRVPATLFSPFSPAALEVKNLAADLAGVPRPEKPSLMKKLFGGGTRAAGSSPAERKVSPHLEGLRSSVVSAPQPLQPTQPQAQQPARAQPPAQPPAQKPELAPEKPSPQKLKDDYMRQWMEGKITLDQMMEKLKELGQG